MRAQAESGPHAPCRQQQSAGGDRRAIHEHNVHRREINSTVLKSIRQEGTG